MMCSSSAQALQQQQEVTKAESSAEEKRINELRWKADADLAAEKAERARAEQAVSGCHLCLTDISIRQGLALHYAKCF